MVLRHFFRFSEGELRQADAKPCFRLMRHTTRVFTVCRSLFFWIICKLHYGLSSLLYNLLLNSKLCLMIYGFS
ncbi:hypothetical protein GIB67_029866 [Kingdonia uniflora]|uniref:DUF7875 domain-containing protein n=1 Tax=Kingdonia uniflora TaxID=39325 RepID=A0A7J7NJZ7_9MAGN|nr:hypothetical protein GIB67_029866 [Kingdonia uniflora]